MRQWLWHSAKAKTECSIPSEEKYFCTLFLWFFLSPKWPLDFIWRFRNHRDSIREVVTNNLFMFRSGAWHTWDAMAQTTSGQRSRDKISIPLIVTRTHSLRQLPLPPCPANVVCSDCLRLLCRRRPRLLPYHLLHRNRLSEHWFAKFKSLLYQRSANVTEKRGRCDRAWEYLQ